MKKVGRQRSNVRVPCIDAGKQGSFVAEAETVVSLDCES